MTQQLVECIPNFSEGRRLEVVDAIVEAISAVSGVTVLDHSSDADHNRSVITFAGPPDPVAEAAYAAIAKAAELIDMDTQTGKHPRLGATDVVPFVPLAGMNTDDCVALAHALGRRVGEELGIPVYHYEAAATRSNHVNLADVRRGEYEALKEAINTDPDRAPDFGPKNLGKAGAVIIGARAPLIAYNVYLTTDDVKIAKRIARAIRHSTGGLRFVKGLGLLVEGQAQVSMNLTDFTKTPVARVIEMIRREAARYGVSISHSELIGLIPQKALFDAAKWYLQLDGFKSDQVLETRLFAVSDDEATQERTAFLDELAADTPTPGGGSAAAYCGALGAALIAMVARLTLGKKKYADVQERMAEIAAEADKLQTLLNQAVTLDAQAFDGVMAAYRMPKKTDEEQAVRAEAIEQAMCQAAAVPLEVVQHAVRIMELAAEVAETGNVNAISDAGSAGTMAHAALQAAAMNVQINASSVSDQNAAQEWLDALKNLKTQAKAHAARLHQALHERGGIDV